MHYSHTVCGWWLSCKHTDLWNIFKTCLNLNDGLYAAAIDKYHSLLGSKKSWDIFLNSHSSNDILNSINGIIMQKYAACSGYCAETSYKRSDFLHCKDCIFTIIMQSQYFCLQGHNAIPTYLVSRRFLPLYFQNAYTHKSHMSHHWLNLEKWGHVIGSTTPCSIYKSRLQLRLRMHPHDLRRPHRTEFSLVLLCSDQL